MHTLTWMHARAHTCPHTHALTHARTCSQTTVTMNSEAHLSESLAVLLLTTLCNQTDVNGLFLAILRL